MPGEVLEQPRVEDTIDAETMQATRRQKSYQIPRPGQHHIDLPETLLGFAAFIVSEYPSTSPRRVQVAVSHCFPQYRLRIADANAIRVWLREDLEGRKIFQYANTMTWAEIDRQERQWRGPLMNAGVI